MMTCAVDSLNSTFQKTHEWLLELEQQGGFTSEAQAYSALRAVLHALRDRLTIDEAAHVAAQLPILVRGIYFEGWKPSVNPEKVRTKNEFVRGVAQRLDRNSDVDPEHACHAVFELLLQKVSAGEIADVIGSLPSEVRELWRPEGGA